MASNYTLFLLTALLALTTSPFIPASARPLNCNPIGSSPNSSLASRLNWNEDSSNCWGSLYQLQACSGEVVLFFLNGETYLGHGCCLAIQTIQRQCWPALLGTLGFTTQETDILKGYCDEAADHHIQSPPSTPPPPLPSVDQPANKTDVEKLMFP